MYKLKNILTVVVLLLVLSLVVGLLVAWKEGKLDNLLPNTDINQTEEITVATKDNFKLSQGTENIILGSEISVPFGDEVVFTTNSNDYGVFIYLDSKTPLDYEMDDHLCRLSITENLSRCFDFQKGDKEFSIEYGSIDDILRKLDPSKDIKINSTFLNSGYDFIVVLSNSKGDELTRFSFTVVVDTVSGVTLFPSIVEF